MADTIKLAVREYVGSVAINCPPPDSGNSGFRRGANRAAFPEEPKPVFTGR